MRRAASARVSPPPGQTASGGCCHAHARYAASEPPSNEPKPISSSRGSTTTGTLRPASASVRVSAERRKRELTPSSIGSVASMRAERYGLLGTLR